jgi:fibronectin type 3 domain-containing protein
MKEKFLLCGFALLAFLPGVVAQQKKSAQIKVVATVSKEKGILLRWAMDNAVAWKLGNQYGFELVRYTVVRDGKVLQEPQVTKLSQYPLKPKPLATWETIVQKDQYAAVIAQALYGDKFEVSGGDDKGVARLVNLSQEQEQRFALSLYAADNSFEAAKMAGWGWEDNTVLPNEKYLYRLCWLAPAHRLKVDTAGVFIGMGDYQSLPKPTDLGALFGDKHVMLSWDYSLLKSYYSSWIVEKSADGKNYQRLSAVPVTNFNEKEKKASPRMYLMDSLGNNTTIYYYRIKGISAFGEAGPPSDSVSGKGRNVLAYVPNIRSNVVNEKGVLEMSWEFENAGNAFIKSFSLNRAPAADGPYVVVKKDIHPDSRTLQFSELQATNYFTITAVAKEGESTISFPVLVQPVDSIPPVAPTGLTGFIDSSGVVRLSWTPNKEKDMLGYKVFRAFNEGEELASLVDAVHFDHSFTDTVNIKTLNSKVYYAVTALDQRYNQSPSSAIIAVRKPDVIPPTSPVFSYYKVENGMVKLEWFPGKDEDLAMHLLYRRMMKDSASKWQMLEQLPLGKNAFIDRSVMPGNMYTYIIIARDSSGLESTPVQPVTVHIPQRAEDAVIRGFSAYVNREQRYIELSWNDRLEDVVEYHLYKGEKGKAITLWKICKKDIRKITDEAVNASTNYVYGIKPVLKSGATGMYKAIDVEY